MDFDFSAEQKEIRHQARRMLAAECDLSRVRRVLDGETLYDAALWQQIAELGWLGVAIPEAYGGMGLGYGTPVRDRRGAWPRARAGAGRLVDLPRRRGDPAGGRRRREAGVAAVARRRREASARLALAEGMSPLAALDSVQARCIDGMLSGTKLPVPDGCIADFAIVSARIGAGGDSIGLFIVELDAPGRAARDAAKHRPEPAASAHRVRRRGRRPARHGRAVAAAALRRVLDRAAVLVAFEQIGGADAALAMATDYAKLRHAFGRPIGSFQAIKHKLADMYTRNELARSNAYYAAWALDSSDSRPAARRRRRARRGQRGLRVRREGKHPDARRHRRHVGGRHAPALPPLAAADADARQPAAMAPAAGRAARSGRVAA